MAAVIDRTLRAHPHVAEHLRAAHDAAWSVVDPVLLELCRLRIAQLLGDEAELATRIATARDAGLGDEAIAELATWPTSARIDDRQRACLALCEQFVIDVANVTPDQTAAVTEAIGEQGLADLVSALLVVEQRQRLRLAWNLLFDRAAGGVDGP